MSVTNFRRYVRRGQIVPAQIVERNQMFATRPLQILKRALSHRGRTKATRPAMNTVE